MADITSDMIKELRERTQAGMLDCKKALIETNGDMEQATDFLRKKGLAAANKKAGREAKEGIIAVKLTPERAILLEVNCETDFVAKNANFIKLSQELLDVISKEDVSKTDVPASVEEMVKSSIGTIGENMGIGKFTQLKAEANTVFASYVHSNNKIGVVIQLETAAGAKPEVEELGKELAMQAAAAMPQYLNSSEIPESVIQKEKEIYFEQMKDSGKPANVLEKIVEGKINKFYSDVCLIDQVYIKDSGKKISDVIKDYSSKINDEIKVAKFIRFQVGA
ncbi:MAG: translation elongation factor Ts [Spirochaetes bacterium]|nr:translation elongation factor Ts [Spirochaetota bacterium]